MLSIGHRGAKAYEPENTLRSFKKALKMGVNAIEFDVHGTKDKKIAIIHDSTINRTTNGKGKVKNFTLKELKKFDAGKGEKIPSLKEALNLLNGKCKIFIELKEVGLEKEVLKLTKGIKDVLYISFHSEAIKKVKEINPTAETGFLFWKKADNIKKFLEFNKSIQSNWLGGRYKIVNRKLVEQAKKQGFKIFVWTINKKRTIKKYSKMGVDGIVSDKPDLFKIDL